MQFYVGLHEPAHARHFDRACISVRRLRRRRGSFVPPATDWFMDSAAYTELWLNGCYNHTPEQYAAEIVRWWYVGRLAAAASQDYMCESHMLDRTGLTIGAHQELTIARYDAIRSLVPSSIYVLPVLQGYVPLDYVAHLAAYGSRLAPGAWVGVGSVCKRNGRPGDVLTVLSAIAAVRPDLRLHGFGLKKTAVADVRVAELLHSSDSLAWSARARWARRDGELARDANDWREAAAYVAGVRRLLGARFS